MTTFETWVEWKNNIKPKVINKLTFDIMADMLINIESKPSMVQK